MEFENLPVEIEGLPKIEKVTFNKLEKDYLWLRMTFIGIIYLLVLMMVFIYNIISSKFDWWLLPLIATLIFAIALLIESLGFRIKGYVIRQNDISYKSGLIFFSMTSVPFNRIQHTEVTQGPLGRLFDLAKVKVYTAGGSSSDITIVGLNEKNAHQLKDHITEISSKYV